MKMELDKVVLLSMCKLFLVSDILSLAYSSPQVKVGSAFFSVSLGFSVKKNHMNA